jgi:hypothetical protein
MKADCLRADLVSVVPLVAAIGCRVCRDIRSEYRCAIFQALLPYCPAEGLVIAHAAQRMVNLMGAWHNQLIEVRAPYIQKFSACAARWDGYFMEVGRALAISIRFREQARP